jgi:hypothetical protein
VIKAKSEQRERTATWKLIQRWCRWSEQKAQEDIALFLPASRLWWQESPGDERRSLNRIVDHLPISL